MLAPAKAGTPCEVRAVGSMEGTHQWRQCGCSEAQDQWSSWCPDLPLVPTREPCTCLNSSQELVHVHRWALYWPRVTAIRVLPR